MVWGLLLIAPPGPLTPPIAWADDSRAREIMQKVNDRDDGDNQISEMKMTLIDRNNKRRVRQLKSFNKDKGKDELSIMFFVSPADVKGTGFLTYDYDESGKDDDQWLYLPALRKTKRIASSDKSGSFMGSDFNYSDLTERDLEDYDFTLMKEVAVEGHKTWQIQALPRSKDVADETGYSKSIMWVRQDIHMVVRSVGWVYKSRRLKYFQIKKLEQIDGIWVGTEMQMVTKEGRKTVHATVLNFDNVKFNQALDPAMFTVRRLEKGI
ncbi:MAG: outer membrane lipoprotein-sorting protein [SAR324 cluster bacterium]|nr:outer membrane lipoprotein-sorting protein [SAR324 cluster bacterium]